MFRYGGRVCSSEEKGWQAEGGVPKSSDGLISSEIEESGRGESEGGRRSRRKKRKMKGNSKARKKTRHKGRELEKELGPSPWDVEKRGGERIETCIERPTTKRVLWGKEDQGSTS